VTMIKEKSAMPRSPAVAFVSQKIKDDLPSIRAARERRQPWRTTVTLTVAEANRVTVGAIGRARDLKVEISVTGV
jgi:hypothetical protein